MNSLYMYMCKVFSLVVFGLSSFNLVSEVGEVCSVSVIVEEWAFSPCGHLTLH